MGYRDDPDVRWPDAVLPGSAGAREAARRARIREERTDARREQLYAEREARDARKAERNRPTG